MTSQSLTPKPEESVSEDIDLGSTQISDRLEAEKQKIQDLRKTWEIQELVAQFNKSLFGISRFIRNRESLLRQSQYALLTAEHQLIISGPGRGKSLYSDALFRIFPGESVFSMQFSRTTREDEVFGSPILDKLKEGSVIRNLAGSIVDARFARLDELLDANMWLLRSLHGVFHERKFSKGQQEEDAKLHTAIATTNRFVEGQELEAFSDRWLYQSTVPSSSQFVERNAVDRTFNEHRGNVHLDRADFFDYQQLLYLTEIATGKVPELKITTPPEIRFLKNLLIREYEEQIQSKQKEAEFNYFPVTNRTSAKAINHLNATALLRGRSTVTAYDLLDLRYLISRVYCEKSQSAFDSAVKKVLSQRNVFTNNDIGAIKALEEAVDLVDETFMLRLQGVSLDRTLVERIKKFLHLATDTTLTFGKFLKKIKELNINHESVKEYRDECVQYITEKMSIFSFDAESKLFE
ncbi:MAG: AAA family ATPase [Bdellovibrionales bacterium]|nr:AAA family ATPase [Bdellovibrionales bacterium]